MKGLHPASWSAFTRTLFNEHLPFHHFEKDFEFRFFFFFLTPTHSSTFGPKIRYQRSQVSSVSLKAWIVHIYKVILYMVKRIETSTITWSSAGGCDDSFASLSFSRWIKITNKCLSQRIFFFNELWFQCQSKIFVIIISVIAQPYTQMLSVRK